MGVKINMSDAAFPPDITNTSGASLTGSNPTTVYPFRIVGIFFPWCDKLPDFV